MIDKIKIYTKIEMDTEKFDTRKFKLMQTIVKETGEIKYFYFCNYSGIKISYFIDSQILRITGRLILLSHKPNRVNNLDSLWVGDSGKVFVEKTINDNSSLIVEPYYDMDDNLIITCLEPQVEFTEEEYEENLDSVIYDINNLIMELTQVKVDIKEFNISYLEVCFNIHTDFVNEYITLFNTAFKSKKLKRHMNYIIEEGKEPYTSCYIQTKSDFENKKKPKTNYTVNFYNKLDQLNNELQVNSNKPLRERKKVCKYDLKLAENVLRLEVQCRYHYLRSICNRHNISRTFGAFINIDICSDIIKDKYRYFIDNNINGRFMNYKTMQNEILNSQLSPKDKKWLTDKLIEVSQNHTLGTSTLQKYKKLVGSLSININLIPTKWNINCLPSPMSLLDKYVEDTKQHKVDYLENINGYTHEEAIMSVNENMNYRDSGSDNKDEILLLNDEDELYDEFLTDLDNM